LIITYNENYRQLRQILLLERPFYCHIENVNIGNHYYVVSLWVPKNMVGAIYIDSIWLALQIFTGELHQW